MRNVAGVALGTAALFLSVVAVMLSSPGLFFMSATLIALIGMSRLQAWLSVRALRMERSNPPAVRVGDEVTVQIVVWSDRRLKRPLISVQDELPTRLAYSERTPSLPVAPSYDQPILTHYRFRPLRRGRFTWSEILVQGTDALGLVTMSKRYRTEPAELVVYPAPVAVSIPFQPGIVEEEAQRRRGSGVEPKGVREYSPGDPQRFVHWPSSARVGKLMVKEFEAGSGRCALFAIQRTRGSDIGDGEWTTLEAMCGHAVYMAHQFLLLDSMVGFPTLGDHTDFRANSEVRKRQIDELLAFVRDDQESLLSDEILQSAAHLPDGAALYAMLAVQDPGLPEAIRRLPKVMWTVLVYDPADYPTKHKSREASAAHPDYLASLRGAGAEVVVMPKVTEVSAGSSRKEAGRAPMAAVMMEAPATQEATR